MKFYLQSNSQALEHMTAVKRFQIKKNNCQNEQDPWQNKQLLNIALKNLCQEVFGHDATRDQKISNKNFIQATH